jgi:hypothetical protein
MVTTLHIQGKKILSVSLRHVVIHYISRLEAHLTLAQLPSPAEARKGYPAMETQEGSDLTMEGQLLEWNSVAGQARFYFT